MQGVTLAGIGKKVSDKEKKDKETLQLLYRLPKKVVIESEDEENKSYDFVIMYQSGKVWANYFLAEGNEVLTDKVKPSNTLRKALFNISNYLRNESGLDLSKMRE